MSTVPHILLEEIGAPYQLVFVNLSGGAHKRPDYLRLNPNGLIPVLVQDDLVIYESAAICLHLIDTHPTCNLAPVVGSSERALFYQRLMWFACTLQPALSMYLHPNKSTNEPAMFPELRVRAEEKVNTLFELLDATLEGSGGPWLTGNTYSAADAYAFTLCRWSRGMARPGASWPHIGPYLHRILARPAVQRALQQEHLAEPWI
ncbi:glutathione S-transferase family protein [Bradyrhizobium uaiense]|uniref:glutathione S-transferase family protein n=1 Tax=Bradyrhizobium uaiense TaxID=2594946 RepID=UPI003221ABCB